MSLTKDKKEQKKEENTEPLTLFVEIFFSSPSVMSIVHALSHVRAGRAIN